MREQLRQLKMHIYEDGRIDENEVALLRRVFAGGFARDEAQMLLDLNNVLSGTPYPDSFDTLFVDVLSDHVVGPTGAVAEESWAWLESALLKDGTIDTLERRLLDAIAAKATRLPEGFEKYRH